MNDRFSLNGTLLIATSPAYTVAMAVTMVPFEYVNWFVLRSQARVSPVRCDLESVQLL